MGVVDAVLNNVSGYVCREFLPGRWVFVQGGEGWEKGVLGMIGGDYTMDGEREKD